MQRLDVFGVLGLHVLAHAAWVKAATSHGTGHGASLGRSGRAGGLGLSGGGAAEGGDQGYGQKTRAVHSGSFPVSGAPEHRRCVLRPVVSAATLYTGHVTEIHGAE
jgi:hypothetical protein